MPRPLAERAPRPWEVALAIAWPVAMVGFLGAAAAFTLLGGLALSMPAGFSGPEMMRDVFATSASLAACPAAGAVLCFSLSALGTRLPGPRSLWLRRVAAVNWLMTTMLLAALAMCMVVVVVAWLTTGFEEVYGALLLTATVIVLIAAAALRMRLWLRSLAARTRRWARRYCGRCGYDFAGFQRCPECGTDRWTWLAENRSPAQRRLLQRRGFAPPE